MGWFGTMWAVGEAAVTLPAAAREAADVFADRGPLASLEMFAARTSLPPAVAAEARTLAVSALTGLHLATGAAVACVDVLTAARPVVARAAVLVDQGIGVAVDVGWWAASAHARVAGWIADAG